LVIVFCKKPSIISSTTRCLSSGRSRNFARISVFSEDKGRPGMEKISPLPLVSHSGLTLNSRQTASINRRPGLGFVPLRTMETYAWVYLILRAKSLCMIPKLEIRKAKRPANDFFTL